MKELNAVSQTIFDRKGFNILVLDVRGISTLTDFFIIAEGTVDRHVRAIGSSIQDTMHQMKLEPLHVEGEREGDWVVLDYGNFIVHIFTPDVREKYAIEKLWKEAKIVDVKIDIKPEERKK